MVIGKVLEKSIQKTQTTDFGEEAPSKETFFDDKMVATQAKTERDLEKAEIIAIYQSIFNPNEIVEILSKSEHVESDFVSSNGKMKLKTFTDTLNKYVTRAYSAVKEVKRIAFIHGEFGYIAYIFTDNQTYDEKLENKLLDKYYNFMKKFPDDHIEVNFFPQWSSEEDTKLPNGAKVIFGE